MKSKIATLGLALAASFAAASPSAAATTDIFMKVTNPPIPGEATLQNYVGQIQLLSYSQSVQAPAGATGAGGGVVPGRPTCGQIVFTKNIDKASPHFVQAVMQGTVITDAVISFVDIAARGGGQTGAGTGAQRNDYTVTLKDAVVTSVQQSDTSPAELVETVTLRANSFSISYVPYTRQGASDGKETLNVNCDGALLN